VYVYISEEFGKFSIISFLSSSSLSLDSCHTNNHEKEKEMMMRVTFVCSDKCVKRTRRAPAVLLTERMKCRFSTLDTYYKVDTQLSFQCFLTLSHALQSANKFSVCC